MAHQSNKKYFYKITYLRLESCSNLTQLVQRLSISLVISLVFSQLTCISCLCRRSFSRKGIRHRSDGGTGSSLSLITSLISAGLAVQGLRPVSAWMLARLMPVVEDLSRPAMLATRETSSLRLFRRERKKFAYLPINLARIDKWPADSRLDTKY